MRRLNIASCIHNHRLLNHIHKTSNISTWGGKGSENKRDKESLGFEKTISLLTEGESGELPKRRAFSLGTTADIQEAEWKGGDRRMIINRQNASR